MSGLARYFDIPADRTVVLHDELDLPFDTVKVKQGGGHGGHNGLRDIAKALDTPEFLRVRIGIGRPPGQQDPAEYVLKPFASSERDLLAVLLEDAADAALEAAFTTYDIGGFDRILGAGTIYKQEYESTINGSDSHVYKVTLATPSGDTALAAGHVATLGTTTWTVTVA